MSFHVGKNRIKHIWYTANHLQISISISISLSIYLSIYLYIYIHMHIYLHHNIYMYMYKCMYIYIWCVYSKCMYSKCVCVFVYHVSPWFSIYLCVWTASSGSTAVIGGSCSKAPKAKLLRSTVAAANSGSPRNNNLWAFRPWPWRFATVFKKNQKANSWPLAVEIWRIWVIWWPVAWFGDFEWSRLHGIYMVQVAWSMLGWMMSMEWSCPTALAPEAQQPKCRCPAETDWLGLVACGSNDPRVGLTNFRTLSISLSSPHPFW